MRNYIALRGYLGYSLTNGSAATAPHTVQKTGPVLSLSRAVSLSNDWGAHQQLPAFMVYLLSRPIDIDAAASPLLTDKKQQITDASQDYRTACVRAFLEETQSTIATTQTLKLSELCDQINEKFNPQFRYIPRFIKPILEGLGYTVKMSHGQNVLKIEPCKDAAGEGAELAGGDEPKYLPLVTTKPVMDRKTGGDSSVWDAGKGQNDAESPLFEKRRGRWGR